MSIFLVDINHEITACRYTRTLGSEERFTKQLSRLEEYANKHEMVIVDTIVDYNGGDEIDRMKIEELYAGIEQGRYEAILVTHSDRIANNPKDVEAFYKRIEAIGGIVYSLEEGYCRFHSNQK